MPAAPRACLLSEPSNIVQRQSCWPQRLMTLLFIQLLQTLHCQPQALEMPHHQRLHLAVATRYDSADDCNGHHQRLIKDSPRSRYCDHDDYSRYHFLKPRRGQSHHCGSSLNHSSRSGHRNYIGRAYSHGHGHSTQSHRRESVRCC